MTEDLKTKIIQKLQNIKDIKGRFSYLIELGKNEPDFSESEKSEDNRIKGCNSLLWLVAELKNGKVFFKVDSDAGIPKGLGTLIAKIYSGLTPQEILATDTEFLNDLGIKQHLSMNRRNGLANIMKQMKYYAVAFSAMV